MSGADGTAQTEAQRWEHVDCLERQSAIRPGPWDGASHDEAGSPGWGLPGSLELPPKILSEDVARSPYIFCCHQAASHVPELALVCPRQICILCPIPSQELHPLPLFVASQKKSSLIQPGNSLMDNLSFY